MPRSIRESLESQPLSGLVLQQLKEIPLALASLRQSVDQLAGSQQQIAGTIAKLGTRQQELLHKLASPPPRPGPAPAPKPLALPQAEVR